VQENQRTIHELQLFRTLVDRSNDSILVVNPKSLRFLDANEKACAELGYSAEELLSMKVSDIDPRVTEEATAKITEALMSSGFLKMESVHRRKDGSTFPVELCMTRVQIERDYVVTIARDLTGSKRAEEKLREYERVVESLEEMIVVVDRNYRYVIANRAFLNYRGMQKEQVIGRRVDEVVDKDVFDSLIKAKMDECFCGKVVAYELKNTYPTLGERELLATYFPIEGPTGVDRIAAVLRDVTERNCADQALRYAKDFSQNVIQTANVMILGLDREGNVNLLNEAGEEITGYTFAELKGRSWAILVPRERFPHVWAEFDRIMEGTAGRTFENPILTKSGEERYIAWRNSYVKINGAIAATISFGNDITERRRAEEALRCSEENYRMFISQSSEGIFREDMDAPVPIDLPEDDLIRHILYDSYLEECNDALAAMYGLHSADDLRGKRLTELLPPEDPRNIELTRHFVRSGFRVLDRESHEVDIYGNPKVFLNSMIGVVENGMLVRTWGIQRDVTEKVKLEEARRQSEEALRQNVTQLQAVTEELRLAKEKLSEEKLYLEQTIDSELGFGEIIGRSPSLQEVMGKVAKVAPSDASVLLLGETGTGKELVARAIHRLSGRKDNSFVKVNCAAIPSGLLESELFGHEKGAFTGAIAKKIGRLELADQGTLFLDEIGEIPLDLQPKLLRVLQDQEFERLGGTQTLKVDFRLVAATNRELLTSVNRREFRSDLYYRLNVFPLRIPPLRERREDIPLLIEHFVKKYASRMNKSILSIPSKTMETLVQWAWPGNIRELENFLERSVILTPGGVLQVPLSELRAEPDPEENITLWDKERDRILRTLRECRGQLGGPGGAAARLGLKRTTLQSKLNQFGIKPEGYRT
jgi:formate hydrogenlyase transcriptional activator